MTDPHDPQIRLPWGISWLTVILAALALISFLAISSPQNRYYATSVSMGSAGVMEGSTPPPMTAPSPGMPTRDAEVSNVYYDKGYPYPYYPNPDVPATDTREFLKVYYSASLQTRDAQGLTSRVATTVRGYGGRIDQESSSEKYGYISFAMPQAKYDAFRTELESLVDKRFITINISSQNLLPQKVSIEEQQAQADKTLAEYKTARQKLITAHTAVVATLQAKIDITTDQTELAQLKKQLATENASYTAQLNNSDANIKYATDWQTAVENRDEQFLDSVATVSGSVSVQWISLWDMAQKYLPGYSIPSIFAVLAVLSFIRDRRRRISLS